MITGVSASSSRDSCPFGSGVASPFAFVTKSVVAARIPHWQSRVMLVEVLLLREGSMVYLGRMLTQWRLVATPF